MKPLLGAMLVAAALLAGACHDDPARHDRTCYSIAGAASGCTETADNIANISIVSKDANAFRAEYLAGFVQGRLQAKGIAAARDNAWDSAWLTDPDHTFPRQLGPTRAELDQAAGVLLANYEHLQLYISLSEDAATRSGLIRLEFRLVGIYHGATRDRPAELDFSGTWLPSAGSFRDDELRLGYETPGVTFLDVYFVNANQDLWDAIAFAGGRTGSPFRPDKCSAFLKRSGGEIFLAHNTWSSFLSQTQAMNLAINDTFLTVNAFSPGLLASGTDFGYNGHGVMFNETTHRMSRSEARTATLWTFMRAALAEQFSTSIDDFFRYISLENSGTYLNGYMLVDAKTNETALVEMSHKAFVFYRSSGGPYGVTTKPAGLSTAYDTEMVRPEWLMGINYPASQQVRDDLLSDDNRPARRRQFARLLPALASVEDAKRVITYTDPANPLSLFGRWDLGYGETPRPKTVPDGSVDAKVATASMARDALSIEGVLDTASPRRSFWMLYGTPYVGGEPFVWSRSRWSSQKLRDVPDVVDGRFDLLDLNIR